MTKRVSMYGAINGSSGYGNAVRNFAEAFSKSKVPTKFVFPKGKMKYIRHLKQYTGTTNVDFYLHCPPFNKHKSSNYKIGYFYWEATQLPHSWKKAINKVNELWLPCELVKKACLDAGFKGKIKIVPTPLKPFNLNKEIAIPSPFSNDLILSKDIYKFYSIFQWHERKGYKELLKAYLSEFTPNDNVVLILKVNPLKYKGNTEAKIIKDILKVKSYLGNKKFPPIYLSKKIISEDDLKAIHIAADCYVSPHHGEGWGMPIHDAMWAGNQVITTQFGGVTEHLSNQSAHLINYELKPVTGMDWSSFYNPSQRWAYPKVKHLAYLMRDVYLNHHKYEDKAKRAKEIADSMTINAVVKIINRELR